jgi:hypothetical protein
MFQQKVGRFCCMIVMRDEKSPFLAAEWSVSLVSHPAMKSRSAPFRDESDVSTFQAAP